ncbi:hypothetical protein ACW0TN_09605 [Fusobacterium pseudoperiodonticum]
MENIYTNKNTTCFIFSAKKENEESIEIIKNGIDRNFFYQHHLLYNLKILFSKNSLNYVNYKSKLFYQFYY